MPRYKAIGRVPVPLHSGRVLAPGEQISKDDLQLKVDEDNPLANDQGLIDSGRLVELPSTRNRTKKEEGE